MPNFDRPYYPDFSRERERGRDRRFGRRDREPGELERGRLRGRESFEQEDYGYGQDEPAIERERRFSSEPLYDWERGESRSGDGIYAGTPAQQRGYERHGRFAGLGPKGYQRSDERLREEICDRLTADPDIDASGLTVTVKDSEVTIEGRVADRQMKRGAEDCIENISGVRQVHNRLRVEAGESYDDRGAGGAGRHHGAASEAGASEEQRSGADRKASH